MEFVPTSVKLDIALEDGNCDVCVVADAGIVVLSSRVGSVPAGDAPPSGHPGCGLGIIGVDAEKPWTSSFGGRCAGREVEPVF